MEDTVSLVDHFDLVSSVAFFITGQIVIFKLLSYYFKETKGFAIRAC